MLFKRSIARRLSRYVLLISAGLLLAVTLPMGYVSRIIITRSSIQMATKDLELAICDIEKVLTEVETAVGNVDWFVQHHEKSTRFMYEATRELVSANPNIIGSAVAFEPYYFQGRERFSPYSFQDPETGELRTIEMGRISYDYPTFDWYKVPKLHDRPFWSEPYFDEGGGKQRMATYSLPLKDTTGRFFGILTSDISLERLSDRIQQIAPYEGSSAMLISANGTFIAHPDSSKVLNSSIFESQFVQEDPKVLLLAQEMTGGKKGSVRFGNGDITDYFAVYGPLSNGWSVLLVNTYVSVFKNIELFNSVMGILLLLGLAGLYFGCCNVIRQQTMPIVEFSNAAMTMAKGNFRATIPAVRTQDELLTLRNSLDYMQRSINDYIVQLKTTMASNERYESELTIARNIQMSMLPQDFPKRADFSLYAMVQPAKEVGGDLYDFIVVDDAVYFLVGDVSGKGVPAALFMSITRAAFRFVGSLEQSMADVMRRVNNCLCDGNRNEMFVTIFAGRLDLKTGELSYCNAGHNPIVVISPEGEASYLHAKSNLVAGLFENFPYEDEKMQLEPGTRLVLYTDGVTEAEREDHGQYGEDRLLEWAGNLNPEVSSEAAAVDLYASVRHFTQGAVQNDDITVLSLLYMKQNDNQA